MCTLSVSGQLNPDERYGNNMIIRIYFTYVLYVHGNDKITKHWGLGSINVRLFVHLLYSQWSYTLFDLETHSGMLL
jgi:hypothetical protein